MANKQTEKTDKKSAEQVDDQSKRDFVIMTGNGLAAIGACAVAVPLIDSMNPSADVLAQASVEVDISTIAVGEQKKVMWRGKPVFVYRRTPEQIKEARADDNADMKDPETDEQRVKQGKDEWLVMVGVCTHLGCIPLEGEGAYGGWFCPCHGSAYDISGRIRKGPAPKNLVIPPYEFLSDTKIKIG